MFNLLLSLVALLAINVQNANGDLVSDVSSVLGKVKNIASDVTKLPQDVKDKLDTKFNNIKDDIIGDITGVVNSVLKLDVLDEVRSAIVEQLNNIKKFEDIDDTIKSTITSVNALSSAFGKSDDLNVNDPWTQVLLYLILDKLVIPRDWISALPEMVVTAVDAIDALFDSGFPFIDISRRRRLLKVDGFDEKRSQSRSLLQSNSGWSKTLLEYDSGTMTFTTDIGKVNFNGYFRDETPPGYPIIRRKCMDCDVPYRWLYFRWFNQDTLGNARTDMYSFMKTFDTDDYEYGIDYKVYDSFNNVLNDIQAWDGCDYYRESEGTSKEVTSGAFGKCYRTLSEKRTHQWVLDNDGNAMPESGRSGKSASFTVLLNTPSPTPYPTTSTPTLEPTIDCFAQDSTICDSSNANYNGGWAYQGIMETLQGVRMMGDDYPPRKSWRDARKVYTNSDIYGLIYGLNKIFELYLDHIDIAGDLVSEVVTLKEIKTPFEIIKAVFKTVVNGLRFVLEVVKDFGDIHDNILLTTQMNKVFTDTDILSHNQKVMMNQLDTLTSAVASAKSPKIEPFDDDLEFERISDINGKYEFTSTQIMCAIGFVVVLLLIIVGLLIIGICMLKYKNGPKSRSMYSKVNQTDVETDIN